MVIVMDTDTGKLEKLACETVVAEEFGTFVDEVLNAGWLPQPEARLEVHEHLKTPARSAVDADEFLRAVYRNQE
jgi:hypothetical protein